MNNSPQLVKIGWRLACFASWAIFVAAFTFYTVAVYESGDRDPAAILLFVVIGWPTLLLGTAFAFVLAANRRRGAPRWAPWATGVSLVLFGAGCGIAGNLLAAGVVPATIFWLGIPTLGAAALTSAAARK